MDTLHLKPKHAESLRCLAIDVRDTAVIASEAIRVIDALIRASMTASDIVVARGHMRWLKRLGAYMRKESARLTKTVEAACGPV